MENKENSDSSDQVPPHVNYWLTASDENDCFFHVGPESGPTERIGTFKVFLMGHSEPFRVMLGKGELSEHGDICLPDVKPETFKTFLQCIYHGNCDGILDKLNFEDSCDLLYLVEKYMVTFLKCKLTGHMTKMLKKSFNNVFTALKHPVCFQEQTLEKLLSDIVSLRTKEIISNDSFLEISEDGLMFIVKRPFVSVPEVSLWKAVVKWAEHPTKTDEEEVSENREVVKFLKEMHFTDMTCEEFCTQVVSTDMLEATEIVEICKMFRDKTPLTNSLTNDLHISEMTFSHTIKNISKCQLGESSSLHNFQNFTFSLQVRKETDRNTGLFLVCEWRAKSRSVICNEKVRRALCVKDARVTIVRHRNARNHHIDFKDIKFNQRYSSLEICSINYLLNELDLIDRVIIVVTIEL